LTVAFPPIKPNHRTRRRLWRRSASAMGCGRRPTSHSTPIRIPASRSTTRCHTAASRAGSRWWGTSAAAPAWAGLVAITDQGLATAGKSSLNTTQVLTSLYSLPSSDFNDVTTGNNGYSATPGYDLVTGIGTPKANLVVSGVLAANGVSANSVKATATTTPTATPTTTSTPAHHTTTGTTHPASASKADQIFSTTAASVLRLSSPLPARSPTRPLAPDHGSRLVGDDCCDHFHSISNGFEFLKQRGQRPAGCGDDRERVRPRASPSLNAPHPAPSRPTTVRHKALDGPDRNHRSVRSD